MAYSKYEEASQGKTNRIGTFIKERQDFIVYLHDKLSLMDNEIQSLRRNATEKSKGVFDRKIAGWNEIIDGVKALYDMYIEYPKSKQAMP